MTDAEVLTAYRMAVLERLAIERQMDMVTPYGEPWGVNAQRYDSIGRGTNDTVAAALQKADGYAELLREKRRELAAIEGRFEQIMSRVQDGPARVILRRYYGLGDSDAVIAEDLGMSREWVSKQRSRTLKEIS